MKVTAKDLATLVRRPDKWTNAKHVTCASGLTLSLQARDHLSYCEPGKPNCDMYESLEVATWRQVSELDRYFDSAGSNGLRVFAYVPVSLLVALVNANGGLDPETAQRLRALEGEAERETLDLWSELYREPLQFSGG